MRIIPKSTAEIEIMATGGGILGKILKELGEMVEIGRTTMDLENHAAALFKKYQVEPSFKGYKGYPAILCTSVNEEVVHTFPNPNKVLNDGDIISIDCGVYYEGMHTDSAITVFVGNVDPKIKYFVSIVQKALDEAIKIAKPGKTIGDIGFTIENIVKKEGYSPIPELIGHGIGENLHEAPEVPNCGYAGAGPLLEAGMTIAIEPIISMGNGRIITLNDGWTIITEDKAISAQIEHTIAITDNEAQILTQRN